MSKCADKKLMKINFNKIVLLLLLIVLGLFWFLIKPMSTVTPSANIDRVIQDDSTKLTNVLAERSFWSKRMDDIGVEQAYGEFKQVYADKHFGVQHTVSHIVGQLIYQKKNLAGLMICDSTFAFGCYHSFYSQALAEKGLAVISAADKACIDKFGPLGTGCQHGIGHGLMEYYGPKKLKEALDACSLTTQPKKLFGCTSGVFMEYNVPILITATDAKTVPRILDKKNPYAPCPSVIEKFQESCYYEMPQWWDKENNFQGNYKKIGELCQALTKDTNRESCFLGIGNMAAPSSSYVVADTIKKCQEMPTAETKIVCQSGASWSFYSSVTYRHLATEVCRNLDANIQSRCVQRSDLIGNGLQ